MSTDAAPSAVASDECARKFGSQQDNVLLEKNQRFMCGQMVQFDGSQDYNSNDFCFLDENNLDLECNGKDHDTPCVEPTLYRPMSEKKFYSLKNAAGFLSFNGGNYAGYLDQWYARHSGIVPPRPAMAHAWRHLVIRKQELEDLNMCTDADKVALAQRNVLVARELYAWSMGSKFSGKDDGPVNKDMQSLADIIGDNESFFEEYRIGSLDYWIVPDHLIVYLEKILKKRSGQYYVMTARHDVPTELTIDNEDDTDGEANPTVLFSSYIPHKHGIVCTKEAGVRVTETVLDSDELLKRKRIQGQADRDARKKRRDGGYQANDV